MILDMWARRWNIPAQALADLRTLQGIDHAPGPEAGEGSESRQQTLVRLEAAQLGVTLTRNNVGAWQDPETARVIRYGLFNESKAQNKIFKSGDLVGIKPVLITTLHVGMTIGQFVMRECKEEQWRFTGTEREVGQLNAINFINSKGGDAAFAAGPGSFNK